MKKMINLSNSTMPDNLSDYKPTSVDYDILGYLVEDGRKSLTDIAKALDISVGTVRNRVARLKNEGIINILGIINPNQIGFNAYAQIFIAIRPAHLIESIAKKLVEFPETSFVAEIAGEFDLEINIMCKDNNHLTSLMNDRLYKIKGIYNTKTNMYLKVYKVSQPDLNVLHP